MLKKITISDFVQAIGNYTFSGCTSVTKLTLGKGLRDIGSGAFSGSDNIETIYTLNPIPPACADASVFAPYVYNAAALYVPNERNAIARYKADNVWSKFFEINEKDFSGITDIVVDKDPIEDVYYNLNGQRVINPSNGIFIKNGQKVIIR